VAESITKARKMNHLREGERTREDRIDMTKKKR
jgi:hypothetical protein